MRYQAALIAEKYLLGGIRLTLPHGYPRHPRSLSTIRRSSWCLILPANSCRRSCAQSPSGESSGVEVMVPSQQSGTEFLSPPSCDGPTTDCHHAPALASLLEKSGRNGEI